MLRFKPVFFIYPFFLAELLFTDAPFLDEVLTLGAFFTGAFAFGVVFFLTAFFVSDSLSDSVLSSSILESAVSTFLSTNKLYHLNSFFTSELYTLSSSNVGKYFFRASFSSASAGTSIFENLLAPPISIKTSFRSPDVLGHTLFWGTSSPPFTPSLPGRGPRISPP